MDNRIEPWERLPKSLFPVFSPISRGETIGTKVTYDGVVLRTRGDYSYHDARAMLSIRYKHMIAEGIAPNALQGLSQGTRR